MTRDEHLSALIAEHGRATDCELPDTLPRYALMQADEGPGDNGGPWWDFGDDWRLLAEAATGQEHPEDWPAKLLVDLDTGGRYDCELQYHVHVYGEPS